MKTVATLVLIFILYWVMRTIVKWPIRNRVQKALWSAGIGLIGSWCFVALLR